MVVLFILFGLFKFKLLYSLVKLNHSLVGPADRAASRAPAFFILVASEFSSQHHDVHHVTQLVLIKQSIHLPHECLHVDFGNFKLLSQGLVFPLEVLQGELEHLGLLVDAADALLVLHGASGVPVEQRLDLLA